MIWSHCSLRKWSRETVIRRYKQHWITWKGSSSIIFSEKCQITKNLFINKLIIIVPYTVANRIINDENKWLPKCKCMWLCAHTWKCISIKIILVNWHHCNISLIHLHLWLCARVCVCNPTYWYIVYYKHNV